MLQELRANPNSYSMKFAWIAVVNLKKQTKDNNAIVALQANDLYNEHH